MASITEVSDWLISLKLLWINMWPSIEPMGQVWSTCIWVDVASWWIRSQCKDTDILWGPESWKGKLTLFSSVYFTGYVRNRIIFNSSGNKFAHRGATSIKGFTSCNSWTISSIQYIYGKTSGCSWLDHYPGSGFGERWIRHPRVRSVLEIHIY